MIEAAMPISLKLGSRQIRNVEIPISEMVNRKVNLRPILSPDAAEYDRPERAHGKARGESEKRKYERRAGIDAREELLADDHRERADQIRIVCLKDRFKGRRNENTPVAARHARAPDIVASHSCLLPAVAMGSLVIQRYVRMFARRGTSYLFASFFWCNA